MAELTPTQEAQLTAYVERMYAVWLPTVEQAVLAGYTRFGIAPDPAAIATTSAVWRQQVDGFVTTQLTPVAEEAYVEEDPAGSFVAVAITVMVAATTTFLLAQILEVQADLTTILATATSVAAAVVAMRDYLNPAAGRWRTKAVTVAQTEGDRWVQFATLTGARSAQRRDGVQRIKQWVSRDDNRVRPAHVLADGQRRPLDVAFDVAGFPMQYPKDPSAPPELVVNCRCGMNIKRLEAVPDGR